MTRVPAASVSRLERLQRSLARADHDRREQPRVTRLPAGPAAADFGSKASQDVRERLRENANARHLRTWRTTPRFVAVAREEWR